MIPDLQQHLVRAVRRQCKTLRWDGRRFAHEAGISACHWSAIQCGTKTPSLPMMHKIASAVGLDFKITIVRKKTETPQPLTPRTCDPHHPLWRQVRG
jgi:transcriptional regulator with XRE-family HTH domain